MTEHTFDDAIVSDLHKDAYGFRPGQHFWTRWKAMDADAKQKEWDHLVEMMESEIAAQRGREAIAKQNWEKHITEMMADHSVSKQTAIRWDMEAMDADGDIGYYCFKWGIGYSNEEEIKQILHHTLPEGKTLGELLNLRG